MIFETQPCIMCDETSKVEVEEVRYYRWSTGEFAQDVWPEWSDDKRELLITGTHSHCWDEMDLGET